MNRLILLLPLLINIIIVNVSANETFIQSVGDFFEDPLGLILPGTKWCGPGNDAENEDDLGYEWETDMCCRAHDHCPIYIDGSSEGYGLKNADWFTRVSCECEAAFNQCLKNVNKTFSLDLGRLYFRLRGICIQEDYPIVKCEEKQGTGILTPRRCIKYQLDQNGTKIYQYFDTPFFYT